jgi:hypothetical protein
MDEKAEMFLITLGAVIAGLIVYGFVSKYIPTGL